MELIYVGPSPAEAGLVPLPEGWPAAEHDEPDRDRGRAKLESGFYKRKRALRPEPTRGDE